MPNHLPISIQIARRLASTAPERRQACPVCAASLKGANLDRHLSKVHSLALPGTSDLASAAVEVWQGVDGKMRVVAGAFALVWLAAFLASTVLLPPGSHREPFWIAVTVGSFCLVGIVAWLAAFNKFGATLSASDTGLELRYGLGLLRKSISWPRTIGYGQLRKSVMTNTGLAMSRAGYNASYDDERAGSYLLLTDSSGKSLRVGTTGGTGFGKHWQREALQSAARKRSWDLLLTPAAMVQLEYHLSSRSGLLPRQQDNASRKGNS